MVSSLHGGPFLREWPRTWQPPPAGTHHRDIGYAFKCLFPANYIVKRLEIGSLLRRGEKQTKDFSTVNRNSAIEGKLRRDWKEISSLEGICRFNERSNSTKSDTYRGKHSTTKRLFCLNFKWKSPLTTAAAAEHNAPSDESLQRTPWQSAVSYPEDWDGR